MTNRFVRKLRISLAAIGVTLLGACGGGGSQPSTTASTGAVAKGTVQSGLVVPSASEAATVTVGTNTTSDSLVLSGTSGVLQNLQNGQVVVLPANDAQGLPMGFAGRATIQPNGTVTLTPAAVGDVFKSLKIDFDSARDGGQITGLIVPKGGKLSASIDQPARMQSGLEYISCQMGLAAVVDIKCKNGELEGSISLEHPIKVKKKGGAEETAAKLYAKINLSKLSTKVALDFDEVKYASTGGFNLLKTEVKGEWGASMGIKLEDEAATAEIPAWSELIRGDGANIWDENTKVKFGKYFELSGLNGDDKKGLVPLGGIYLTPANLSIGGQTFGGELTAAQLGQIKGLGMILWLYMDLSGKLSISGEFKFVDVTGGGFDRGFKLERVDGTLVSTVINTKTIPNVLAPYVKGKIEVEQTLGAAVAVDVLFAGIRPATVKSTLLGFKSTGAVEGEGGYRWWPQPAGLQGSLCASGSKKLFTDFVARAAVNAKIDVGWISVKGGLEKSYEPAPYIWWEDSSGLCVDTFTLPTRQVSAAADASAPEKTLVEMSFAEAYNNAQMRRQVGRWQIFEEGPLQSRFFDADSSLGGAFSALLSPGKYTYTVIAWHKDINDVSGKPIEVARSGPLVVNITALPAVDYSVSLVGGDCTKLQLDSLAKAAAGQSLINYKWSATAAGGSTQTQQGAVLTSLQLTLPSCGSVQVTHIVTDDQGRQATVQRSIDTTGLAANITDINPKTAVVNVPVVLNVSGNNLPSTAVLSMADANCAAPIGMTSSGFSVSCTALTTGSKTVTIKTNTQSNGGKNIDVTRTINVTGATPISASKLPHTGITASQCYAAGSNTLVACSGSGALALNSQQDGHRADINAMSYSLVLNTSGGNYSKEECVKDNVTGLIWEGKTASGLRAGSNLYTHYFNGYNVSYSGIGMGSSTNSDGYVNAVNGMALCGFNDWRMPTLDELQTIVNYGVPTTGPAIDTAWFPNTIANFYWTDTPVAGGVFDYAYAGLASVDAWCVGSWDGQLRPSVRGRAHANAVRLVRSGQ